MRGVDEPPQSSPDQTTHLLLTICAICYRQKQQLQNKWSENRQKTSGILTNLAEIHSKNNIVMLLC